MMRLGTRKAQGPVSISNARVSMICIGRNGSQGPEEAFGALLYLSLPYSLETGSVTEPEARLVTSKPR